MNSRILNKRNLGKPSFELLALSTLAVLPCLVSGCIDCAYNKMIDMRKAVAKELHVGSSEEEVKHFCSEHGMGYKRTSDDTGGAGKELSECNDPTKPILEMKIQFDSNNRATAFEVSGFRASW